MTDLASGWLGRSTIERCLSMTEREWRIIVMLLRGVYCFDRPSRNILLSIQLKSIYISFPFKSRLETLFFPAEGFNKNSLLPSEFEMSHQIFARYILAVVDSSVLYKIILLFWRNFSQLLPNGSVLPDATAFPSGWPSSKKLTKREFRR